MINIFAGIILNGAIGCLDEFNRLNIECLMYITHSL